MDCRGRVPASLCLVMMFGFPFEDVHEILFPICNDLLYVSETEKKYANGTIKQDIQQLCQQTGCPRIDIRMRRAGHKESRIEEKH